MDAPESPPGEEPGPDGLGLDMFEVRLSPYRTAWAARGQAECARARTLLGPLAHEVVHVGSTAVPGLEAKPIIDIVACVGDQVRPQAVVGALVAGDSYAYDGDRGDDGGLLFVRGRGAVRTVHLHVVSASSPAWDDYRRFHALLVHDGDARDTYQAAKRRLAAQFPHDRPGYTAAKGAVVEALLAADRAARARQDPEAHQRCREPRV